jgi:signal transduction histidine kinase
MIAIPVVLCVLYAVVMNLAMMGIFGSFGGRSLDDERFYQAKNSIATLSEPSDGDNDEAVLLQAVDAIRVANENEHVTLAVYRSGSALGGSALGGQALGGSALGGSEPSARPLGKPAPNTPLLTTALEQAGTHTLILDHTAIYIRTLGDYHLVLTDTNYYLGDDASYLSSMMTMGVGMLILIIVIITVTNRTLTRIVLKSITVPLDTLVFGVRQIRDGNLTFRLEYQKNDEFTPACAAFNDMAARLQRLEGARQKDEESRRELIAGISHDLRTPLTSIRAYLEGIEKGVARSPERQKKYLDTIRNKTADLEHIIDQLFLFSKLDLGEFPLDMKLVDIGQTIAEIVDDLADEYEGRGLTCRVEQSVQGVLIEADTLWLQNVIINIFENSANYKTTETGTLSITCDTHDERGTRGARAERNELDGHLEIHLTDDGPGVPEAALEKLFEVFYRTDPSRNAKGSGLGLAISAQIVRHMGGKMFAQLPPDGGLAIVLRFPLATEGETTEGEEHHERTAP